jgi:cobalt/nickel transport system permease protein
MEATLLLAMHMANELLCPEVAIGLILLAGICVLMASSRTRSAFDPAKVPLMGVMGAFVFAAQMINFPILPGTSGHLGGGVLLAILLGPHAATLVMASILIIQCLIFQDGGLLALGANLLNLGVIPCYLGYACFHAFAGKRPGPGCLYLAVFGASTIGMLVGAACVPFQVLWSDRITVPLTTFMAVMVGLHVLVALGEALITFLVIAYLAQVRPQLLGQLTEQWGTSNVRLKPAAVLASLLVAALLLGGLVSLWASESPDALETATAPDKKMIAVTDDETSRAVDQFHEKLSPLSDYEFTSFSGILGTLVTLVVVWGIGVALRRRSASDAA